jgi:hypothetical protein
MDQEKEIYSLSAEALAIQAVLVHVLRRLAKSDPDLWKAIAAGFEDAASEIGNLAIQHGAEVMSERTLEALRIVEINRKASLGAGLILEKGSSEMGDKSELPESS